jgi:hypothetical protein
VLINHESSIGAILLIALYFIYLVITPAYHLFLHLLSTNHKCNQPCYFPLLLKSTTQKEKMDWNSSTMSFRLCAALIVVHEVLLSIPLFYFARESL